MYYISGFPKDAVDYDVKKSIKSEILEITDNPQEYFITQEKPVSIVSNLTSSLKKLDNNTEPKKSVTFRHDLITGEMGIQSIINLNLIKYLNVIVRL